MKPWIVAPFGEITMSQLTLDAALAKQLHAFHDIVELRDPAGNVVGHYVPEYEPFEPPIDEAELQRREKSDKWHTTDAVLSHLQGLE
jgi:hypothetical protein